MGPSSPENASNPSRYTLTKKDFLNPPAKIVDYKFPEKLTRENFNSWFINGFGMGRGNIEGQAMWMRYTGMKSNFDPYNSLLAFDDAGALSALSPGEQDAFRFVFDKIPGHKENEVDLEADFHETFDLILDTLATPEVESFLPGWEAMEPEDFVKKLRAKIDSKIGGDT